MGIRIGSYLTPMSRQPSRIDVFREAIFTHQNLTVVPDPHTAIFGQNLRVETPRNIF